VGPREFLPSNVSVREWDAFTEVPEDLVGQFDIVNLRLFGFVIQGDPQPVLRNLIRLLSMFPSGRCVFMSLVVYYGITNTLPL
jgi:hypothetical protein